ncbi:MAG: hypothetical protein M0Z67_13715 [Nitrospiraceae bacterium]|nr:hypothetical protein [Nitrospiraceae bacterium]
MTQGPGYGKSSMLPAGFVVLALSAALLVSCSKGNSSQLPKRPNVPVTVGTVTQKTVPVQLTAVGNVEAVSTIW